MGPDPAPRVLGQPLVELEVVESTNLEARRLAREGRPEGTAVLAARQTGGRGRLGRAWFSPAGNLYLSVVLRPPLPPAHAPQLSLMAGVALAEAIAALAPGVEPRVKWPNDVWLGGRKVAGVLAELETAPGGAIDFVIVGIGVNLVTPVGGFPAELREIATSLQAETGQAPSRDAFARALLRVLEHWYNTLLRDGFEPVRAGWEPCSITRGLPVAVRSAGELLRGVEQGIEPDGALRLRRSDGAVVRVLAGDLEWQRG
ncbi:MAG: biotin--[acetyl-CoA-carboxylase] ligase [Deltaproteobacteria bacterium]|nr:biotin--[acetyl-CoA-carboxylase] ligase [Deltaproteobacteria bacterium]MBI3077012.1 biotin--[acetyl-CoA-carboxylase] ligase [Deltaproteobacteria bacterium]